MRSPALTLKVANGPPNVRTTGGFQPARSLSAIHRSMLVVSPASQLEDTRTKRVELAGKPYCRRKPSYDAGVHLASLITTEPSDRVGPLESSSNPDPASRT